MISYSSSVDGKCIFYIRKSKQKMEQIRVVIINFDRRQGMEDMKGRLVVRDIKRMVRQEVIDDMYYYKLEVGSVNKQLRSVYRILEMGVMDRKMGRYEK